MLVISKEEGGTQVYIRGLGDRYVTTSFNGLPLPSNDPELKNIALDLFSTDIIEFVAVDKLYNSEMFGDFGGGNIDRSEEHTSELQSLMRISYAVFCLKTKKQ